LKFGQSGKAVARIRLVANSRKKNEDGEWVDDKTLWMTGTAFDKQAENVAESLAKGDLVVVSGRLQTDEWEANDGTKRKRTATTLVIDSIGPSLRWDAQHKVQAASQRTDDNPWGAPDASEPPF
jgi:single-strand DNA-binding protein